MVDVMLSFIKNLQRQFALEVAATKITIKLSDFPKKKYEGGGSYYSGMILSLDKSKIAELFKDFSLFEVTEDTNLLMDDVTVKDQYLRFDSMLYEGDIIALPIEEYKRARQNKDSSASWIYIYHKTGVIEKLPAEIRMAYMHILPLPYEFAPIKYSKVFGGPVEKDRVVSSKLVQILDPFAEQHYLIFGNEIITEGTRSYQTSLFGKNVLFHGSRKKLSGFKGKPFLTDNVWEALIYAADLEGNLTGSIGHGHYLNICKLQGKTKLKEVTTHKGRNIPKDRDDLAQTAFDKGFDGIVFRNVKDFSSTPCDIYVVNGTKVQIVDSIKFALLEIKEKSVSNKIKRLLKTDEKAAINLLRSQPDMI